MVKKTVIAKKTGISIVIPAYNEEADLRNLYSALRAVLIRLGLPYEIIFIDDGSTDHSLAVMKALRKKDHRVKIFVMRRNFGKARALNIGFIHSTMPLALTMDADLQDDPEEIPNLLAKLDEGYDMVSGWKKKRHDPLAKTLPSRLFNCVTRIFTGVKLHDFNCGLKLYRAEVVKSIDLYGEMHRFIPVIAFWRGFSVAELAVNHHPRRHGQSKYGVERLLRGLFDFITVLFITKYTTKPMHFFGLFGVLFLAGGSGVSLYLTLLWALTKAGHIVAKPLSQRPLLLLGVLLIMVGIQFLFTGLLGEMMILLNRDKKNDINAVKESLA